MRQTPEHDEQVALFRWIALNETKYPVLALAFSTQNGMRCSVRTAVRAKAAGNKKGVPDIFLPVPIMMGGCMQHGLWIEMKSAKGQLKPEQKAWFAQLSEQDYTTAICRTWIEAVYVIADYLGLPELKEGL